MMAFSLLVPFLLIGAVAYALGWRPQLDLKGPAQTSQTPLEILKTRYAQGEITREAYDQLRQDLEG